MHVRRPVLRAELNWLRSIARTKQNDPKKAVQLETLAARIAEWRAQQAAENTMAPGVSAHRSTYLNK